MTKTLMVQGTMSNVGKSLLTAGLCRVFRQDGYSVAPFKSQNMALNSFITADGLEMGRAQAVQALSAGIEPEVSMNPILLKPVTDMGSQVIVNGEVRGNMRAADYFEYKKTLIPDIKRAFETLSSRYDIVVIEGAGSPAEINLNRDDIVNMGLAKMFNAPVLLVGDIDRGGIFAQLFGTLELLERDERALVKGLVVNKFRGDIEILRPGLSMLEEKCKKSVVGVLPYLPVDIDDEDSLSERLGNTAKKGGAVLDIAVIRLPKISNFTDFTALEASPGISLRYVSRANSLGEPDMVIIPGTKNTVSDLRWLRERDLQTAILRLAQRGTFIFGICGGYQIMGERIRDSENVEGGGEIAGLGLLPVDTEFHPEKNRLRSNGTVKGGQSGLSPLNGAYVEGYEIHMGITRLNEGATPLIELDGGQTDGCALGNAAGTYLHGFFDSASCREALVTALCEHKGVSKPDGALLDLTDYREEQFNILAEGVRGGLDMEFIYNAL